MRGYFGSGGFGNEPTPGSAVPCGGSSSDLVASDMAMRNVRNGLLVGVILVGVAALAVGILSLRAEPGASPWVAADDANALDQLESELAREVRQRKALSERVAELDEDLSRLRVMIVDSEASPGVGARENSLSVDDAGREKQSEAGTGVEVFRFDDEVLLSRGIRPEEVERLHDRWVLHELDTAVVSDKALREGWFLQKRHSAELSRLDRQLREDLEDEEYDRYLYALGKPNRLTAVEVFKGSSASEAGLRRGDIILRYGEKRVFRRGELLVAAAAGQLGESVAIEILRNGHRETIYVERGPFGVMLEPSRGEPLDD